MGDPVFCKGCKAVLSMISKLEVNKWFKNVFFLIEIFTNGIGE